MPLRREAVKKTSPVNSPFLFSARKFSSFITHRWKMEQKGHFVPAKLVWAGCTGLVKDWAEHPAGKKSCSPPPTPQPSSVALPFSLPCISALPLSTQGLIMSLQLLCAGWGNRGSHCQSHSTVHSEQAFLWDTAVTPQLVLPSSFPSSFPPTLGVKKGSLCHTRLL